MLVAAKFICYLMWCPKKQATAALSPLDISVSKKVPFKPPLDNRILVNFLMMDFSCCKVFGIYTEVLKDVSITEFVTIQ